MQSRLQSSTMLRILLDRTRRGRENGDRKSQRILLKGSDLGEFNKIFQAKYIGEEYFGEGEQLGKSLGFQMLRKTSIVVQSVTFKKACNCFQTVNPIDYYRTSFLIHKIIIAK